MCNQTRHADIVFISVEIVHEESYADDDFSVSKTDIFQYCILYFLIRTRHVIQVSI